MSQVLTESEFEYIERLPDGKWLIRYGIVPVGYSPSGERLLTFGSSVYPSRPSVLQVIRSLYRYAEAFGHDEAVMRSLAVQDLSVYFDNLFT